MKGDNRFIDAYGKTGGLHSLLVAADDLPRQRSLAVLLGGSIFFVTLLVLVLASAAGFWLSTHGVITSKMLRSPTVITLLCVLICVMLTFVTFAVVDALTLRPMRNIISALHELGEGNFDVRMRTSGSVQIYEIEEFVRSFNRTANQLGNVEMLRSSFIDDFSHEFKTPIVSIKGFAELLAADGVSREDQIAYAGIIARESDRLASMASDVLLIRQAETLESVPNLELIDISELVRRALIVVQRKWSKKNTGIQVDVTDDVVCRGNDTFLNRAFTNVLDNALKFAPENTSISISLSSEGGRASFVVENDAPDMKPDVVERVFDRFYQADASHATQGCGLGLPLVRRIAHLHGGSASAELHDGAFKMTISLPCSRS